MTEMALGPPVRCSLPPGYFWDERYGSPQTVEGNLLADVALILQDCLCVDPANHEANLLGDEDAEYLARLVISRVLREPVTSPGDDGP